MKQNKQQARFGSEYWYPLMHRSVSRNAFNRRIEKWIELSRWRASKMRGKLRKVLSGTG